jgi:hypothetical protein
VFGPIGVHIVSYSRSLIGLVLEFYEINVELGERSECSAYDVVGTARKRRENYTQVNVF